VFFEISKFSCGFQALLGQGYEQLSLGKFCPFPKIPKMVGGLPGRAKVRLPLRIVTSQCLAVKPL
jgi:hypothetical protein